MVENQSRQRTGRCGRHSSLLVSFLAGLPVFFAAAALPTACTGPGSKVQGVPDESTGPTAAAASSHRHDDRASPRASVPGPASASQSPSTRPKAYRVAAMGDSLTDARSKGGAFLDVLRERCPKSLFDNYGVGGQMVNQMRSRFGRQIVGEGTGTTVPSYSDVIVWGGVNDLYSDETAHRTVAKIEGDLSAMYTAAHGKGLRVVAVTVAPWGGFKAYWKPSRRATTLELNAWIREAKSRVEVDGVVDAWALLSCGDADVLCPSFARGDGLHVTMAGHHRLGEDLHARYFADCE